MELANRPDNSNADEWQLWLIENGVTSDNAPYIAIQICEAIEKQLVEIKYLKTIMEMRSHRK